MSEKTQSPNVVSIALTLVVVALGYHVVSNYSSSPRPAPLEAGASRDEKNSHKVEFRLWQDPLEPFEPSTNQSASAKSDSDSPQNIPLLSFRGQGYRIDLGSLKASSPHVDHSLVEDVARHMKMAGTNTPVAFVGVMLEGGSYAEDKEARLRERYAVELAFLTGELGPEDRTHISTNSIKLKGDDPKDQRTSNLSYEWFKNRSDASQCWALVLWLNEYDFSDDPARRLNSLIRQVFSPAVSNSNAAFFLIGPRTSDTLRALDLSLNKTNAPDLIAAAELGRFKILSPEATAILHDPLDGSDSWQFSSNAIKNPNGILESWVHPADPVSWFLKTNLPELAVSNLSKHEVSDSNVVLQFVADELSNAICTQNFSDTNQFPVTDLPPETTDLARTNAGVLDVRYFNGLVLEDVYSNELWPNQASDPYGRKLQREIDHKFDTNKDLRVFHNWIATDQRLAELIAEELANRIIVGPLEYNSTNVVVILSEQDTYFGSRLADEWIDALVGNGVCDSGDDIWQFSYLRGLDGSKPATEKPAQKSAELSSTSAEQALQTLEQQQQQNGLKADGNAQMDYISRLAETLREKDLEMQRNRSGRIIAVGLTGSDVYDKLILLREMSQRLPEAVFFTTDLDAPLWTANVLPRSRNLLVASAYGVEAEPTNNSWPLLEEFAPFRDVYQAAVYRACNVVVTNLWETNWLSYAKCDAPVGLLKGSLWEIGRRGPVLLNPALEHLPRSTRLWQRFRAFVGNLLSTPQTSSTGNFQPRPAIIALLALGLILTRLWASSRAGINWRDPKPARSHAALARSSSAHAGSALALAGSGGSRAVSHEAQVLTATRPHRLPIAQSGNANGDNDPSTCAVQAARRLQLPFSRFILGIFLPLFIGTPIAAFFWVAWQIARQPGEEPWNFLDGVSIWPSECVRLLTICAAVYFFWWSRRRLFQHWKRLWRLYFVEQDDECWENKWDTFWDKLKNQGTPTGKHQEDFLITPWVPRFVPAKTNHKPEAAVDVEALFKSYLRLGRFWVRIPRVFVSSILYLVLAFCLILSFHGAPTWLLVRGYWSHIFDRCTLILTVIMVLLVLFYMLDAALLTRRILNCISVYPTQWPERPLRERAADFSVREEHLDGLFDVEFTAIQTHEVASRMFFPFLLLVLLIISRSGFLDNWTWPLGLVIVTAMNFALGAASWFLVRDSAQKVREFALKRIDLAKSSVNSSYDNTIEVSALRSGTNISKKHYLENLDSVRQAILNEKRGAYAPVFQDPSYLGVWIPSGISGIIIPLLSWWFSR